MNLSIDMPLLIIGIVELILTLIVSILVVFLGHWAFSLITKEFKETDELKNNNIAVGIISAAIIIGMAMILKSAIGPSITTLRILVKGSVEIIDILLALAFFVMFFIVSGIIAFIVILLSSLLYNKLTKSINEFAEIKNNNIAVAIVLAAVIIGISLIVQDGVAAIVSGIQPWPEPIMNDDVPTKVGLLMENVRTL